MQPIIPDYITEPILWFIAVGVFLFLGLFFLKKYRASEQEARAWLATCPASAQLAADLRAVSVAVASEPVPPRRRDFRFGPEQAEALRGDAFTRFLRRLSLPRTRAFAPAWPVAWRRPGALQDMHL